MEALAALEQLPRDKSGELMQWQGGEGCGLMLRRGPLTRSKVSPGLAKESARPMTRSLAVVAILTVILRGLELPRAAPLEPADEYAFWL